MAVHKVTVNSSKTIQLRLTIFVLASGAIHAEFVPNFSSLNSSRDILHEIMKSAGFGK